MFFTQPTNGVRGQIRGGRLFVLACAALAASACAAPPPPPPPEPPPPAPAPPPPKPKPAPAPTQARTPPLPPVKPGARDREIGDAMREFYACLNRASDRHDDRSMDADAVAHALIAACEDSRKASILLWTTGRSPDLQAWYIHTRDAEDLAFATTLITTRREKADASPPQKNKGPGR